MQARALRWEATLIDASNLVKLWIEVQRSWVYLQPIFGSDDIQRQMPQEGRRFAEADRVFRRFIASVLQYPHILECVQDSGQLFGHLQHAIERLDEIQKNLARFLEKKRLAFPRFFFLGNDELLEILAESRDPTMVQQHLPKSFEGMHTLVFQTTAKGRQIAAQRAREQAEAAKADSDLSLIHI